VAAVFAKQAVVGAPGEQASMTASSHASEAVSQYDGKPAGEQKSIKATYYVNPTLIKSLKFLSVETDKDLSTLVNVAIKDLLVKHKRPEHIDNRQ
jgi:hypothetical protein